MKDAEPAYSALVVSPPGKVSDALTELLPEARCASVAAASDAASARRILAEFDYDFVFVNSPLPDETGIRFAADLTESGASVVLLLVRAESLGEIDEKVSRRGVLTLAKPTSKQALAEAVRWMRAVRERLRRSEKKTLTLEEKMTEIRLVNRAKWVLITSRGMDEAEAHRWIEKRAMDRCVTRREIAEEIIQNGEGRQDGEGVNEAPPHAEQD
ncbi:MAG: ANTAR domain-containing protein [Clostridiales bacterium]|nr:ANTAR domain-containing protein [Clostridiales bacterium]